MFEKSCFDRQVEINSTTYWVEAPSLGLGLQILHVLDNLETEDDEQLLFRHLSKLEWSSTQAISDLRRLRKKNHFLFASHIKMIVMLGLELPKEIKKRVKDLEDKKETAWRYMLAEYCRIFNANPYHVWDNTPFTFFVSMMKEIAPAQARNRLDMLLAVGHGMSGGKVAEKWGETASSTMHLHKPEETKTKESEHPNQGLHDAMKYVEGKY